VSTEVASVSAENAKMLAHSLQQLLAEQVRISSHSLQAETDKVMAHGLQEPTASEHCCDTD